MCRLLVWGYPYPALGHDFCYMLHLAVIDIGIGVAKVTLDRIQVGCYEC